MTTDVERAAAERESPAEEDFSRSEATRRSALEEEEEDEDEEATDEEEEEDESATEATPPPRIRFFDEYDSKEVGSALK